MERDGTQMFEASAPPAEADEVAFDRWLHEFDVKLAALDARQDALLRRLGVRVNEDAS